MTRFRTQALSVAAVLASSLTLLPAAQADSEGAAMLEEGKKIAFTRAQGNCLACHYIEGGESPGTIAPPLVAMSSRYPDKAALRQHLAAEHLRAADITARSAEDVVLDTLELQELDKVCQNRVHSLRTCCDRRRPGYRCHLRTRHRRWQGTVRPWRRQPARRAGRQPSVRCKSPAAPCACETLPGSSAS